MTATPPPFVELIDEDGVPYLSANAALVPTIRSLSGPTSPGPLRDNDACTFLDDQLNITRQVTGIFDTDLTSRDDVILATFSLVLILALEGIFTTLLLRTRDGAVSNFAFSIKHFLELARDFKFRYLLTGRGGGGSRPRRLNVRLLAIASFILLTSFALEVAVLFLSSPHLRDVTTRTANFQLIQAVNPEWGKVWLHSQASFDRPCREIQFGGVKSNTNMVPCVTSNISVFNLVPSNRVTNRVDVEVVSDIHDYGAQHYVSIDDVRATYSARCYFGSGGGGRIMKFRERFLNNTNEVGFVHKQYVAYLFNKYARETADTAMSLVRLNSITFNFTVEPGPVIDVIKLNGKSVTRSRQVTSTRHQTKFKAVVPRGYAALRLAAVVFRASMGIAVSGPDLNDLHRGSGNTFEQNVVIWREEARTLNWLTLSVVLASAVSLLFFLRFLLKPVATAEIAGIVFQHAAGRSWKAADTLLTVERREYSKRVQLMGFAREKGIRRQEGISGSKRSDEWDGFAYSSPTS